MNFANRTVWTADCLYVLRGMDSGSADMIYLDPPFNSKANYAAPIGSKAAGAAFKDTWSLSDVDVEWIDLIEARHPSLSRVLLAAMTDSDKSYLVYMAIRLLEMKRVLAQDGSIYLHCDPTMSHYLKLMMDAIFGRTAFRNEVVWSYHKWTNAAHHFQRNHDTLLFYSVGEPKFNKQYWMTTDKAAKVSKGYQINVAGGRRQLIVYNAAVVAEVDPARYDVIVDKTDADRGVLVSDVFDDINILNSQAKERTGYPTQKPLKLLERIIRASSNEGDMVLDPFCGCATTCVAAETLGRQWAGIDLSPKAVELVRHRLADHHGVFGQVTARTDFPRRTDLGKLPAPKMHRTALYGEQGGFCAGCGQHFQPQHLEVDHIIAQRRGGTNHVENLQLLCGHCNRVKGDRGMAYLRTKLQLHT